MQEFFYKGEQKVVKKFHSIKEASKLTGVSQHTLRFYEKEKLIINVKRDSNGYRQYSDYDIHWIQFLVKVRNTAMPLINIQRYAELMAQGDATILEREQILLKHKENLVAQMEMLNSTIGYIDQKLERYKRIKDGVGQSDLELYGTYKNEI